MAAAAGEGDAAALAAVVDEHYGSLHRLARLVGRDSAAARAAVRSACRAAAEEPPAGASRRGWLLRAVLLALAAPEPPREAAPAAAPADLEPAGSRWEGWWKDDLPATPEPEREAVEQALATLPPGLVALLVLRDVDGLDAAEVEVLLGHPPERQLAYLHHGRTALRNALRAAAATS